MNIEDAKIKFQKTINVFQGEINEIQAGKVSPTNLKLITIKFEDGRKNNIFEVSTIRVISSNRLGVKAFQKEDLFPIEKAISFAGLGVNTERENGEVIVTFPKLTQERRAELAKSITLYSNKAKEAVRSIRHEYLKSNKSSVKEEQVKSEKEIQKEVDKFNKEIDKLTLEKQTFLKKI